MESIICDICKYLLDNISEEISIDDIEKEFHYNRYYLIRAFKIYTGFTMREFTNTVKVLKSVDPLLFTNDTILKIALNNGFNSQEYYSEKFQSVIGLPPLKFRKEYSSLDDVSNIDDLKNKRDYLNNLYNYRNSLLNSYKDNNKVKKLVL